MKKKMNILKTILENEEYLKDFITRSTYNSNAIEGNKLTLDETRELLYCDINLIINADGRSINEAINHKSAMEYVFLNINNDISNPTIENINDIINGNFKKNFSPDYYDMRERINKFKSIADLFNFEWDPLWNPFYVKKKKATVLFEVSRNYILFRKKHPFKEGNDKTGRILINYELIKNNIAPIVIEEEDMFLYLKFMEEEDVLAFGGWMQALSDKEKERLEYFEDVKKQKQIEKEEKRNEKRK